MYRFYINNISDEYHYMELARAFLPDDGFEIIPYNGNDVSHLLSDNSFFVNASCSSDRDEIKRELFHILSSLSGIVPPWGTLTGVRPLKPVIAICRDNSLSEVQKIISDKYLLNADKVSLITDIAAYQLSYDIDEPVNSSSIYIGIPFCPTRCEYCSFASNVASEDEKKKYLGYLIKEIEHAGHLAAVNRTKIESVYIGGGTPTSLDAGQLAELIEKTCEAFHINAQDIEFTVEAGRPDTITVEKLKALKSCGINRISINPQSMKDATLDLIGRSHTADDIRQGFKRARDHGFGSINADLIAGLPGENKNDFAKSLSEIIDLKAENITIHTLSVKKGSRLKENDPDIYRRNANIASDMLDISRQMLSDAGYKPYYIYRQKHQTGSLENVGWCKPGMHSLYNIRIMADKQTIIGLGAGAVGKVYYPDEDRIERIANVSNYKIYMDRFDDILDKKKLYYK